MKVLVVDDSKTMRRIHKRMLTKLGVTDIREAGNGLEALASFKADPPDLILLDWNMPQMDGITFLKTVRKRPAHIRVIMVTSEAEKSRILNAVRFGANDYMVKPFTEEGYLEKVKGYLEKKAS